MHVLTCQRRPSAKPMATSIVHNKVYWSVQYSKGMGPANGTAMRSVDRFGKQSDNGVGGGHHEVYIGQKRMYTSDSLTKCQGDAGKFILLWNRAYARRLSQI